MTQILKIINDWKFVKNVSRTTVNKQHSENEATINFKKKILISEHSPIREIVVKWSWRNIKSWIATHFSRHKYECYIGTQRSDRTGVDRDKSPQDTPVNMDNSANAQNLIDVSRKRLCHASNIETVEKMKQLKVKIKEYGEVELSDVLVPNCVYRNGCPEFEECGFWSGFKKDNPAVFGTIQQRYDSYNKYFYTGNKRVSEQ